MTRHRGISPRSRVALVAVAAGSALVAATAVTVTYSTPAFATTDFVRVNQVGYLPDGPKAATVVTDATTALPWQLKNKAGTVVRTGTTVPRGLDATSGEQVATLDFSGYTVAGNDYTLVVDGVTSYPFAISTEPFQRLRKDSKTFFYTNRSGIPILDSIAPGYGRAAGHIGVAPNQGDTAVGCQKPAAFMGNWTCPSDFRANAVGGWYDAGDHGKYVVNGGIAVAQLLGEYERNQQVASANRTALGDGSLRVPETGNRVPDILDEARWELEWMLKMQVPADTTVQGLTQYRGMAFHKLHDDAWTDLPLAPAADPRLRELHRPSTAATLNLAAVAAQGARLFAPFDPAFSQRLLAAARRTYAAAKANPAVYAPVEDGNSGGGPYDDKDVSDEFYWAAAELWITTGEQAFQSDVTSSPVHTADIFTPTGFSWQAVAPLARLNLATARRALPDVARVRASVIAAADRLVTLQASQPYGQPYAPSSFDWGSNSNLINNLVVIATAYDLTAAAKYRTAVLTGVDYLFGRNAMNLSYVTGYGTAYAKNQHSRWYAKSLDPALPNPPAGTLAGGPNSSIQDPVAQKQLAGCKPQRCYIDDIQSWSTNEITINWNSALSWLSSFVADLASTPPGTPTQPPSSTPTPTPPPTVPTGSTGAKCTATFSVTNSWSGGFVAAVKVTAGSTPISGWTVALNVPAGGSVANLWNGTLTSTTVRPVGYNAAIAADGSTTFGFQGTGPTAGWAATSCTAN